jgi:hypothetical protein
VRQLGDAGEDIGDLDQLPDGGDSDPFRTPTIVLCPKHQSGQQRRFGMHGPVAS